MRRCSGISLNYCYRFDVLMDDTYKPAGEILTFKLYYFLEDDTIAIKELKENREGRDYFPMYLKRTKIRKNTGTISGKTNASITSATKLNELCFLHPVFCLLSQAEYNETDPDEFYGPNDLQIGQTLFIFGRRFLLTDCDLATRRYYADVLKNPQPEKIIMEQTKRPRPHTVSLCLLVVKSDV